MGVAPATVAVPVPGSQVSVVQFGKPTVDDINTGVVLVPFCKLVSLAGSSYPSSGSDSEFGMVSVVEDNDGMTNIATSNHVFIRTPGRYDILASVPWSSANINGDRSCVLYINNNAVAIQSVKAAGGFGTRMQVGWKGRCVAGDDIVFKGTQTSGVTLATETTFGGVWIAVAYVGP